MPEERVDHPPHYGGKDDPFEAIKVIDAWGLNFCLGNTLKYINRSGRKSDSSLLEDLKKARWYLDHQIELLERNFHGQSETQGPRQPDISLPPGKGG